MSIFNFLKRMYDTGQKYVRWLELGSWFGLPCGFTSGRLMIFVLTFRSLDLRPFTSISTKSIIPV